MDVYSSIIYNNQKAETTQMPIKWWMNKQKVVYSYNVMLLGSEKEWWTDSGHSMDKPWKNARKAVTKDHTLYDSNYMKCPG